MTDSTRLATYDGTIKVGSARKLTPAERTRRTKARKGRQLARLRSDAAAIPKLRERISELEETLAEALEYVPDYFREKWKLDDPLKEGANDA